MFKKNNWLLGIIIGITVPAIILVVLYGVFYFFGTAYHKDLLLKPENIPLVAIFFNMILFRYYMVNLKYDKTGRGILAITIFFAIFFFANI